MKDVETLNTTIDEWRAEMAKAYGLGNIPGKTSSELAEEFGVHPATMHRRLQKLIKEGKCDRRDGRRISQRGQAYPVSVYQLTSKKEKK